MIIFGIISEKFTLGQPVDPNSGVYYANTITDLLPNLLVVFIVSLIMLRVNWNGKAVSHGKARDSLIRLKGETKAVLLDDSASKQTLEKHSQ